MKRFRVRLLASLITALCCFAGYGKQTPPRRADLIIEDLITAYNQTANAEDEKIIQLLAELTAADRQKGQCWTDIIEYWEYANTEMPINSDRLPKNLPDNDTLCIVVLGYQLNADGSMQAELIGRLETALACAKQYPNAYVLCTGGGTAAYDKNATEAGKMVQWLTKKGISPSRLITENQSLTTAQNAEFSYEILHTKYPEISTVAIVSSNYHIPWGSLMFESVFRMYNTASQQTEIHVAANCAYEIKQINFSKNDSLRYETAGMMELIGDYERANMYYSG